MICFTEGNELFFPGQWKVGSNAGGTIECDTFFSNPQYVFTLAGEREQNSFYHAYRICEYAQS